MSKDSTPVDNPIIWIIGTKNRWLKKEIYIDYNINNCCTVQEFIKDIVSNINKYSSIYTLNYKTTFKYIL